MKKLLVFVLLSMSALILSAQEAVELDVTVSYPYLFAQENGTVYLKVGLTGSEPAQQNERPPINVSIVLDRSGSMYGEKMEQAKNAAIMAIQMLDERDIVSIVTYSDTVEVLVPATRVRNKNEIIQRIQSIYANGNTALFAGVSRGADEVSKFFENDLVNRVILLSDGLANVGPDSPAALGNLGRGLGRAGISVTTIGLGLGYNEDLMVQLAMASDGNHSFVEDSRDLVRIFEYEFNGLLSVVAQDVDIEITCPDGVLPMRLLGRSAEIIGNRVLATIGQIYSNEEKYILLELAVPGGEAETVRTLANVNVKYNDLISKRNVSKDMTSTIRYTNSKAEMEARADKETLIDAVTQIAVENKAEAIRLRDEGKVEEAQVVLEESAEFLGFNARALSAPSLMDASEEFYDDAAALENEEEWNEQRKSMSKENYEVQSQQNY
jgi:Ca-activated chloride channel family protein